MAEVSLKQLGSNASRVVRAVEEGDRVLVTKRSRPAAVILSVDEAEDYLLALEPKFAPRREQGRRDFGGSRAVPLDEI
jgi:prevent-host-death family protein